MNKNGKPPHRLTVFEISLKPGKVTYEDEYTDIDQNHRVVLNMSSSSTDDSSDVESWVEWFLIQEGHEFLCEIDRSFIGEFLL
jgi:uncharacterized protein YndB with AHSA1/START domain